MREKSVIIVTCAVRRTISWDLYILHTNSLTGNGKSSVTVTFFSVIGASPPSCKIEWNYSYREPKTSDPAESLLPGCFVSDSVEGYHVTYYWFHILDWTL